MTSPTKIFHLISYLQYFFLLVSLLFYIPFIISIFDGNPDWTNLNNLLIYVGIALSFSTLQDTTTTQNKFSKRVWESPTKGKIVLVVLAFFAFIFISTGLLLLQFTKSETLGNISIGITVLGIGMIGILKSAIEMFQNHRKDTNN